MGLSSVGAFLYQPTRRNMLDKKQIDYSIAIKVSIISLVVNIVLTLFKLFAGIFAHSMAMVSDAIHSASDVFSTFIVMLGVKLAAKQEDAKHKYGHERYESVAAIVLAMVLAFTGIGIGYKGISVIVDGSYKDLAKPGTLAIVAAVVSIVVKEAMFWFTRHYAVKINSDALRADAWHHRTDALSSIGSFIGILGAMMGVLVLDNVASIVIALLILIDAIKKMTDESCDQNIEDKMQKTICEVEGVCGVDMLKTRMFGNRIYVEIEIGVDGTMSLENAHAIAENVHDKIEKEWEEVKHCTVHVNPCSRQEKEPTDNENV